jgi:hypothetical protein
MFIAASANSEECPSCRGYGRIGREWCPACRTGYDEPLVNFTAYYDEADTHGPSPTVIMAGLVGHTYQWRRFETKLSRIQKEFGFSLFHAKEFKARRAEFKGWSDDKRSQLIETLIDLVLT